MRRTLILGGGIAGLSLAFFLARDRARRVTLLEREAFAGTHSSARNAQIWLPVDDDSSTGPLAARTLAWMSELAGGEAAWLRRESAIVIAESEAMARAMERGAARGGLTARRANRAELARLSPMLAPIDEPALIVDGAGILEPHVMITALVAACRREGVTLRLGAAVDRIAVESGRVVGVELDGRRIDADEVVIASGAWARALGLSAGIDVPLVPLRRHLVVLDGDPRRAGTTVWRFGKGQVYWRPESGGVLTSPCDETPFDPCLPPADPQALEALATLLEPIAPELVEAPVRTSWACLRTYAHDRELVLGPDPRVEGLAWMAGFGGRGMTVAVGAAELCAQAMNGRADTLLERMRPDRAQPGAMTYPSG